MHWTTTPPDRPVKYTGELPDVPQPELWRMLGRNDKVYLAHPLHPPLVLEGEKLKVVEPVWSSTD